MKLRFFQAGVFLILTYVLCHAFGVFDRQSGWLKGYDQAMLFLGTLFASLAYVCDAGNRVGAKCHFSKLRALKVLLFLSLLFWLMFLK